MTDGSDKRKGIVVNGKVTLDHCVIAASDLDRTDAFYSAVFGAIVEKPMANMRQYRIGAQMLNVHGAGLAEMAPADLLAGIPVVPGNSDLCFAWTGTRDELLSHLAACDVTITVGPEPRVGARGPGTSFYFRDPDGSLLEYIVYEQG